MSSSLDDDAPDETIVTGSSLDRADARLWGEHGPEANSYSTNFPHSFDSVGLVDRAHPKHSL